MKSIFIFSFCAVLTLGVFSGCVSYHTAGEPVTKTTTTTVRNSSVPATTTVVR